MSESRHWPGPWMPVQLATNIVQIQPEGEPVDGMVICTVESHWDVMPAGRVKDVQLLATAPDLLAALEAQEAAEDFYHNECPNADDHNDEEVPELCEYCFPHFDNARLMRRAAIAKAKGK